MGRRLDVILTFSNFHYFQPVYLKPGRVGRRHTSAFRALVMKNMDLVIFWSIKGLSDFLASVMLYKLHGKLSICAYVCNIFFVLVHYMMTFFDLTQTHKCLLAYFFF